MVFKILMPRDSLYYSRERNFVLMKKNFPRFLDWRSFVDGRSVCSSKTKVSRYVSRPCLQRFHEISFVFGRLIAATGNRPTRFTMESGLYSPSRIGENRIAAKARFGEDGCWSCVGIERRFVIAKFVFLSVCNGDCVRIERCSGNTKPMINRLLLFLSFVLLACNL